MLPIGIMLANACGFATINQNGWVGINLLVVLFSISIAAFVYTLANFMAPSAAQRLKAISSYEMLEVIISAVILIILIGFAFTICQVGPSLVGGANYTSLFTSADNYAGSLLFVNGINLISKMYTTSIQYSIASNIFTWTLNKVFGGAGGTIIGTSIKGGLSYVTLSFSNAVEGLFSGVSAIFTEFYGGLLAVAFSGLFILFITLPIIQAAALTVLAPLALLFRTFAFGGPQLRKVSNSLLALAIGFYFVFPLMIGLNIYIAGCLHITGLSQTSTCSSASGFNYYGYFSSFLGNYQLPNVSTSFFTSTSPTAVNTTTVPSFASGLSLPATFFGPAFSNLNQLIAVVFTAPNVAAEYGTTVAAYLFLGIVLIAIDMGVTMGFIMGIARGLDSISEMFSPGRFPG
ncbi:MAG: hypothetical protein M1286_01165 [Candidatus Marsarchaeota archaeon]|nr:hypothetical protein [Candidatus Marsarchaeota archaeon]